MKFDGVLPPINILAQRNPYLVGIKGVGMTALAIILQQAGLMVRGADLPEEFVTDTLLRTHDISVDDFSTASLPADTSLVIYSGAHGGRKHDLVQAALKQGIPAISLAQAVGLLSQTKPTIGVCGVGGKSTTSALLSWILEQSGHQIGRAHV